VVGVSKTKQEQQHASINLNMRLPISTIAKNHVELVDHPTLFFTFDLIHFLPPAQLLSPTIAVSQPLPPLKSMPSAI